MFETAKCDADRTAQLLLEGQARAFARSMSGEAFSDVVAEIGLAVDQAAPCAVGMIVMLDRRSGRIAECIGSRVPDGFKRDLLIEDQACEALDRLVDGEPGRRLRSLLEAVTVRQGVRLVHLAPCLGRGVLEGALVLLQKQESAGPTLDFSLLDATATAVAILRANVSGKQDAEADPDEFRDIAASATDWYWEQDENLRFVEVPHADFESPSAIRSVKFVGLTRRETAPLGVSDAQWTQHEADLAARRPFRNFRFSRLDEDQRMRSVVVSGVPIFDESGTFKGYRGLGRDDTIERAIETQLRVRTEELVAAKQAAENASRAKSVFLAHMSHELRTPLNAIIGFSELIRDRAFGDQAVLRYSEYAGYVLTGAHQLLEMIGDILDLSKIESQAYQRHDERVDLHSFIDECMRGIALTRLPNAAELVVDVEAGLAIHSDPRALRHILLNLVSNAIKFCGANGRVAITAYRLPQARVALVVTDNGLGMSAEFLEKAMEPFAQADAAISREYGGTGLGLTIAHNYVKFLGGTIKIESRSAIGTRIEVDLPQGF